MEKDLIGTSHRLGILGGGQLGRMFIQEAISYDIHVHIMENDDNAPSANIATTFTKGDITNYDDVMAFGKNMDVITVEIENVNVKRQKTTVGTVHHQQSSTNEMADAVLSPHPGVFLSTNVDLLEQLLAHKESFAVFDDSEKLERINKLRKAILSEVC